MTEERQADGLIHTLYWNDNFKTMILVKGKTQRDIEERIREIDSQLTVDGARFIGNLKTYEPTPRLSDEDAYVEVRRETVEEIARRKLGIGALSVGEAAQWLQGREYREETTKDFVARLKANNLVAVYGASDDLVEFEGAINDEFGINEEILFADGKILRNDCEDEECPYFKKIAKTSKYRLFADFTDEGFVVETTIPNTAKFTIYEGGEVYGEGLVFSLDEIQ